MTPAWAEALGRGRGGVVGYQARERQKVMRRRTGVRNRSAMLYLALAKETSLCRLCLSSLGQREGKAAVSRCWQAGGREAGTGPVPGEEPA